MKAGDIMKRDDGVEFIVVDAFAHWVLITAKGLDSEEDRVKFLGDDQWVGHSGNGYTLIPTVPCADCKEMP